MLLCSFFFKNNTIWFLWNDLDQMVLFIESNKWALNLINKLNPVFVFQFEPSSNNIDQMVYLVPNFNYEVIKTPVTFHNAKSIDVNFEKKIIFFGEVNIDNDELIDKIQVTKIEKVAQNILKGKIQYDEIEKTLNYNQKEILFCRNLVRYKFLREIELIFSNKILFIGDDFIKYKFKGAMPSNYTLNFRINYIYKRNPNSIFIDLLSKSTSECIYPRSSELLSNVNIFLQLKTKDSHLYFGEETENICFTNHKESIELINKHLTSDKFNLNNKLKIKINSKIKSVTKC